MKRISCLLLCFVLLLGLSATAYAAEDTYVVDEYGLLSDDEAVELWNLADAVSEQYDVGVYIAVIDDYRDYAGSVSGAAEAVYDAYELGRGSERAGILLLLSMADRDYDLDAYGNSAHYAFTDYGKQQLADVFLDDFREDDWSSGFADYIRECGEYLSLADMGQPVDVPGSQGGIHYEDNPYDDSSYDSYDNYDNYDNYDDSGWRSALLWWGPGWVASAVVGILLALLIAWIVKRATMRSAYAKSGAGTYVKGEPEMHERSDIFTHVTQTRHKIETENDHSSGGTTVNSAGHSHSSGKF